MLNSPSFFVVGYPRSGTTLLASLLNRHSKVSIPAETQFYRVFLEDPKLEKISDTYDLLSFYCDYPRIKDLNLCVADFDSYQDLIKNNIRNLLSVSLRIVAEKRSKTISGEKSPAHLLYWESIIQDYPDAKFICIVRDGRDCINSNIQQKWTSQNPFKHAAEWGVYAKAYEELCSTHSDKVYLVKFEDLLADTENVLNGICKFIGCEFESDQLNSTSDDTTVPVWEMDWKSQARKEPDVSRVFAWKASSDSELMKQLSFIMKSSLKKFEYESGSKLTKIQLIKLVITKLFYFNSIYPLLIKIRKKLHSLITS